MTTPTTRITPMTTNPADTAKPGFAGVDENGVTWMLTDGQEASARWVTSMAVNGRYWHTHEEAPSANLTPMGVVADEVEQVVDANDPAQLRRVAAIDPLPQTVVQRIAYRH